MHLAGTLNQQELGVLHRKPGLFTQLPADGISRILAEVDVTTWKTPGILASIGMQAKENLPMLVKYQRPGDDPVLRPDKR